MPYVMSIWRMYQSVTVNLSTSHQRDSALFDLMSRLALPDLEHCSTFW